MIDGRNLILGLVAVPIGGALLFLGMPRGAVPANVLLMLWGATLIAFGAGLGAHER